MPTLRSKRNYSGIDSRPGAADNILNGASAMRDIQLRDKSIKSRKGHQKMHSTAVVASSLLWGDTDTEVIALNSVSWARPDSASGWSYEFAVRFSNVPSASARQLLLGPLNAKIETTGKITVGADVGAGLLPLLSTGTLSKNTDHYISVTYDPSGAGTLLLYIDGVLA